MIFGSNQNIDKKPKYMSGQVRPY